MENTPLNHTRLTENTRDGPVTFIHDGETGTFLMSYPSLEDGTPDMDRWDDEVPDWRDLLEVILG